MMFAPLFSISLSLASMLLFGSFLVFSLFKMPSLTKRKALEPGVPVALTKELLVAVIAAVIFIAGLYGHPWLTGVVLWV